MSESSDMIMCRFADLLDLLIEIEMTVKNNAKNFKMIGSKTLSLTLTVTLNPNPLQEIGKIIANSTNRTRTLPVQRRDSTH